MDYTYEIKIPKERIGVLIGPSARIKKTVEDALHVRLNIDSKEGEIRIKGGDTINMYAAREVIKAIGRGFNPETALLLLKPDYILDVLSIQDFSGKAKNRVLRLKGRVIGAEGQSRKHIEELTETFISIYGKTVSIIGMFENVSDARRAIETLLSGAQHGGVYKWLEQRRSKRIRDEMEGGRF